MKNFLSKERHEVKAANTKPYYQVKTEHRREIIDSPN